MYETYPGSLRGTNTFEQDPPADTPSWVRRVTIAGRERPVTYVVCENAATLVYLVALNAVALHIWESTVEAIETPDFLLFDLDPGDACRVATVARVALRVRDRCAELGLQPLAKTSGARGMHVIAPIVPEVPFERVREITRIVATQLADEMDAVTVEREPRRRPPEAVAVDWRQMGRGMTIVPPLTVRPCPHAPVSMPMTWNEVEALARSRSRLATLDYFARWTIRNVPERLRTAGDAWQGAWKPRRLAV